MSRTKAPQKTPARKALDRALQHGLGYTAMGEGSWSVDNSTHQHRYHVAVAHGEWSCTCQARGYCMHIALVQHRTGEFPAELRREAIRLQEEEERIWRDSQDLPF